MNPQAMYDVVNTGGVVRYHATHPALAQPVAAHCWGVLSLILMIEHAPSLNLIRATTFHDAGERTVGDTPFTAKRDNPNLRKELDIAEGRAVDELVLDLMPLTPRDHMTLKWADMAECATFCAMLWEDLGYPIARKVVRTGVGELRHSKYDSMPSAAHNYTALLLEKIS